MALRLIYGRAGSGKSYYCMQEIRKRLDDRPAGHGGDPLILVVPEQYSLEAEKNLLKALPNGGSIDAQVLSFRRMAYRVFGETGGPVGRHLSSPGKAMLIYGVLEELKEDLSYFGRAAAQSGFVGIVSELITELKKYNITPDILMGLHTKIEEDQLREKIKELGEIYYRFEETIRERYIDIDDELSLMADLLGQSNQFDGAEIWFDEFSGFTPQEFRVIEGLLRKAKQVNVCLCTDYLSDDTAFLNDDVFAPVRNTASKLIELARKNDIVVVNPVPLKERPLFRYRESQELAHMEENLFAYPYKRYTKETRDIEIFTAGNIYSEIENAARSIRSLCREKGIRFRDIAVVTGNLAEYERLISAIFPQYGIPFFIDSKKPIDSHPLIIMLLSMMDIFVHNWSYEAVFRYLKSGMTGIAREDIDVLENYVLANGIRGNQWTKEEGWDYPPDSGFSSTDMTEREKLIIDRVNKIRQNIIQPLIEFRNKTKGRTSVRKMCTALYDFLRDIRVPQLMEDRIETLKETGALALANEYGQIWNIVMEVLDQAVEAMDEESMGIERFRNVLSIGFSEHKIGLIPPALDQVLVGTPDRSRSHEIKALFILGVNDGIFPPHPPAEGILSDRDRLTLHSMGVELAADTRTRSFEEQFIVYSTLATTGGSLYISYPIADHEGGTLRPSTIISRLRKLFPGITEHSNLATEKSTDALLDMISAPLPTFNEFISAARQGSRAQSISPAWKHVRDWYENQDSWGERVKRVEEWLVYTNQIEKLGAEKAERLYGSPVYTSISRLEQYASCPFSYYVRYGLRAKERRIHSLSPPDLGSFMHDVIDMFSTKIKEEGIGWGELEPDWCKEQVSSLVDILLEEKLGWLTANSRRYRYQITRLKRIVTRAVWIIGEHIARSGFSPIGHEVSFGESSEDMFPPIVLELPSGENIRLVGRIDRVDALKKEEGTYIRIIDYKSGSKPFKLSDVYYGLQIQLITYLGAVLDSGEKVLGDKLLPGGVLYFRIDDPMIRLTGPMEQDDVEKAIMKALRMNGLILADVNLVKEMDREVSDWSDIIPVRLKKDGTLGSQSSAAAMEQFDDLCRYSKRLLAGMAREMMEGRAAINPFKDKKMTACRYCPYSSVCQFDPTFSDNQYRYLRSMKDKEVWERIKGGEDENGR